MEAGRPPGGSRPALMGSRWRAGQAEYDSNPMASYLMRPLPEDKLESGRKFEERDGHIGTLITFWIAKVHPPKREIGLRIPVLLDSIFPLTHRCLFARVGNRTYIAYGIFNNQMSFI